MTSIQRLVYQFNALIRYGLVFSSFLMKTNGKERRGNSNSFSSRALFFCESFTGGILRALLTATGNVVMEEKPIQSWNVHLLPLEYTS